MNQIILTLSATVLLTLTQAGCSADPGASALGEEPTLTGQIENWKLGPGYTLQGDLRDAQGRPTVVARGQVDSKGNFRIDLPGRATVAPFLVARDVVSGPVQAEGCTGSYLFDTSLTSEVTINFTVVSQDDGRAVTHGNRNSLFYFDLEHSFVDYIYSARAYTETVDVRCAASAGFAHGSQAMIDKHLQAGWNLTLNRLNFSPDRMFSNQIVTGQPLPPDVKWRLLDGNP